MKMRERRRLAAIKARGLARAQALEDAERNAEIRALLGVDEGRARRGGEAFESIEAFVRSPDFKLQFREMLKNDRERAKRSDKAAGGAGSDSTGRV